MSNNVEKARKEVEKLDWEEKLELLRETLEAMEDDVGDINNIDPVIMSEIYRSDEKFRIKSNKRASNQLRKRSFLV